MQWIRTAVGCVVVVLASAVAGAGVLEPKQVPRDAKWVLHLDMDAARETKAWDMIREHIDDNPDIGRKLQDIETITGMHFPQGLHEMTIFGSGFATDQVVVLLRADVDRGKITSILQANPRFNSTDHGQYDVMSWQHKGKILFGSYYGGNQILIGPSQQAVEAELDLLDGKGDPMNGGSFLSSGVKPGVVLYLAGEGLSELPAKDSQSPIVRQVSHAWMSLEEQQPNLVFRANIATTSAEKAEKLLKAIDGIRAMVMLSGGTEDAPAKAKAAATALQTLSVQQDGNAVVGEWPIDLHTIKTLIEAAQKHAR